MELKPCPFCGCEAKVLDMGWTLAVYCKECPAAMMGDGSAENGEDEEKSVIGKWNRRKKPRLAGFDIEHLSLVASLLRKNGMTPEKLVEKMNDAKLYMEMIQAEMIENMEKVLRDDRERL